MRRLAPFSLVLVAVMLWSFWPRTVVKAACNGINNEVTPYAFETLTISTTAVSLSASVYQPTTSPGAASPREAIVTVETNPIRYRADGLAPTATVGTLVAGVAAPAQPSQLEVCGTIAVKNIQFIRQGAADATINVTYYR